MKVVIFEASSRNHSVMIYNWVKICQRNDWQVLLVTTQDIFDQVKSDINIEEKDVFILRKYSLFQFFKSLWFVSGADYLVLTSLQNYFAHYLVLLFCPCKVILTVHNVNTWFKSRVGSFKGFFKKIVRVLWRLKASLFVVNSNNMYDYLKTIGVDTSSFMVVPFSVRQVPQDGLNIYESGSKISVVYPGMVSTERKDYSYFLNLAQDYPEIDFILLGKLILDEGGLDVRDYIISNGIKNVIFFEDFLDQETFDKIMKDSSILFSHLNIDYCLQGVSEKYGITKDSGISYLMAEYALPLLVNSDFNNFSHLDQSTKYYTCYHDLKESFEQLILDEELRVQIRKNIIAYRRLHSIENVSKTVKDFIGCEV